MQAVVEALVDRNRVRMNVKRLVTILGRKNRPHHRKKMPPRWQVAVERSAYDLTVFKVYCGRLALKIYTKGERVMRIEAMANDVRELRSGRDIRYFGAAATLLRGILERFVESLACVDRCFVPAQTIDDLAQPTLIRGRRIGGIDFNRARTQCVARGMLALSVQPRGFTVSELAQHVSEQAEFRPVGYSTRQAAYDVQKFRSKGLFV